MAQDQLDLFGEKRVSIPDNPTLQKIAELILRLYKNYPDMFEGNTISEVDREVRRIVWEENGLYAILKADGNGLDRVKAFEKWNADSHQCIDPDLLSRARRELVSQGIVKLKASAVKEGLRHQQRLSRSFAKR